MPTASPSSSDLFAAGLPVESAERDTIVALVSLGRHGRLPRPSRRRPLSTSVARHRGEPRPVVDRAAYRVDRSPSMPPRRRSSRRARRSPIDRAVGRVCAELVAPYPPGIPVLAPGEQITDAVLDALDRARADGVRIAYAADPTLYTLRVVR